MTGHGSSGEPSDRTLAPGASYGWPLHPAPAVRAPFREPAHRYGPGHRGVDLGGLPGQPVLAARAGTVVFAGPVAGRGVVSIQHDDGLRTTYEPVAPLVAAGAVVRRGDPLGTLDAGHPGCPDPACLHWGVRRSAAEYLDPLVLVRPARIRLLPVPKPWPGDPG
ncbi:M23 family metallopeptidase [Pseudonocardia bannensis]|uniref:M23 family metallopeptidase n=1 Tax=Pseudonocardia bannensis TaxID=630973 RepID=A0A848DKW7_9PSEU|nr:M23 family metallopeptidase [Pseudonocardia bannensis]NMH93166.1 M23 family metallopeptidase [Pseudonocardia bannensis]